MEQLKPRREFKKGYKNTTTYFVNGIPLDRLDMIYHILSWARDNYQHNYPKRDFSEFINFVVEQGYARPQNVTIIEAKMIAEECEERWFKKSRKLKEKWSAKKL